MKSNRKFCTVISTRHTPNTKKSGTCPWVFNASVVSHIFFPRFMSDFFTFLFYLCIHLFIYLFFWNIKIVKISLFPEIYWISSDLKPIRFHEVVIFANYPGNTYLLKLNNRNIRERFEICSIKKRGQWRCTKVFIVNFGHISPLFQAFFFLCWL